MRSDVPRLDDRYTIEERAPRSGLRDSDEFPGFVVLFASERAPRIGEVLLLTGDEAVFGRGGARDDDSGPRLLPIRQRPGRNEGRPSFECPFLSRVQLRVRRRGGHLAVENLGRAPLRDALGREVRELVAAPGDVLALGQQMLLLTVSRPLRMPRADQLGERAMPAFGEADESGLVGESAAAWRLREAIAFVARRSAHVLVLGPSGTGKEVAAQAIHRASDRGSRRLVARNAATIPPALADAELFGNAANYPNPPMPERPGLVGEADGSTLFLDEIGDLPEDAQTKLLRLLDAAGEYQRLGDARRRTADIRFVGATNRGLEAMRHDVAARLKLRLTLPGLEARREDIPLLARHLVRAIATSDAELAARFCGPNLEPRTSADLVRALTLHEYVTHVRELESLLWVSMATSRGDVLELTPETELELARHRPRATPRADTKEVTAEEVRAALVRAGGVRERAWRDLGLANRYVLKRLIKRFGIGEGPAEALGA